MEKFPGIEVMMDNLENNPHCPHGPTLKFGRIVNGVKQIYFACSAYRDRKDCNFFLRADEKWTDSKQNKWYLKKKEALPETEPEKLMERFQKILYLSPSERAYCHTCSVLVLPFERGLHSQHNTVQSVTDHELKHPSELLKPLEGAKKEAQYLFAKKATRVLVKMLYDTGVRRVLCVGAPRVHEYVQSEPECQDMQSMLLDIDHRHHQFYTRDQFGWFNSFNCHWFRGDEGFSAVLRFMGGGKATELALVTDPPFGGRIEPLAHTFNRFDQMHQELYPDRIAPLPLMWIFPYFMEPMMVSSCPSLTMLDYKVDYDNHPLFQEGKRGRKFGSPVRIFTNIPPSKIKLPSEDGYRECEFCERWVSAENKHCFKCNACTSKDGRTYVHCDRCGRCVKPTWTHCKNCKRCCLPDHECGSFTAPGCFACHQPGHKKTECPLRTNTEDVGEANRVRRKKTKKKKKVTGAPVKRTDEKSSIEHENIFSRKDVNNPLQNPCDSSAVGNSVLGKRKPDLPLEETKGIKKKKVNPAIRNCNRKVPKKMKKKLEV